MIDKHLRAIWREYWLWISCSDTLIYIGATDFREENADFFVCILSLSDKHAFMFLLPFPFTFCHLLVAFANLKWAACIYVG